jgi:hypothetical protein
MSCKRSELIELIEQVDQIHVGSTTIITELIEWLHPDTIETFVEDAKTALEIYDEVPKDDENTESFDLNLAQCSEV